jgi:hypothetical protein
MIECTRERECTREEGEESEGEMKKHLELLAVRTMKTRVVPMFLMVGGQWGRERCNVRMLEGQPDGRAGQDRATYQLHDSFIFFDLSRFVRFEGLLLI